MKCVQPNPAILSILSSRVGSKYRASLERLKPPFSKKPVLDHPGSRDLTQVNARRVEVPEFGLVADDENACVSSPTASRQKSRCPREERSSLHLIAIDSSLQPLPFLLPTAETTDKVSHAGFAASKILWNQSLCLCRLGEHFVIADNGIVKINAYSKCHYT